MAVTRCMIFDFDYTLADSSRGAIECAGYALEKLGYPVPAEEKIKESIGLSLAGTFDFLAGEVDDPPYEEFSRHFVEHADRVMLDRIVMYPDVRPMLEELRKRGVQPGIVSTKYHYRIKAFLDREELTDAFAVIVGGEDVTAHKPDPTGLLRAIEMIDCTRDTTIYVGDSITDAETAKRAAVPFAAVLTGVTPRESFLKYHPLAVLPDLSGIPDLL